MKNSSYTLLRNEEIKDINAEIFEYSHNKTKARIIYLKNDDKNKTFSIGFRTPPHNSTGVAHIMEHSVLCGSKKFPVKAPFLELVKGSLNTFLDAMTFPDKTVYPFSSTNHKDFMNLMDIYMDAVFNPRIYDSPEIFWQEGWHYELASKDDELKYKGVVYNEMKGVFSSPVQIVARYSSQSLYPDNCYGYESGGDPDEIPNLSYQEFLDFHRKYYHPSNSYIFIYGDLEIEKVLNFLDKEYLSKYDYKEIASQIEFQKDFTELVEKKIEYSIGEDEKPQNKSFFSYNFKLTTNEDLTETLALDILEEILLGTQGSPLKNALLKSKITTDAFGVYNSDFRESNIMMIAKNCDASNKDKFKEIIFSTLKELREKGINKRLIEASINRQEFNFREADYKGLSKGLVYNFMLFAAWLYEHDSFKVFRFNELFSDLRKKVAEGYLEDLIEKYFLNNKNASFLEFKPVKGLQKQKDQELKEKLAKIKSAMSKEEIDQIVQNTKKLIEIQSTPDSKEVLESIPLLELKDISTEIEEFTLKEEKEEELIYLSYEQFTNKIVYLEFLFDAKFVKLEDTAYLALLANVLGSMDTKNYSYEELSNEKNIHLGSFATYLTNFGDVASYDKYYPKFGIKSKFLANKIDDFIRITKEILFETDFSDYNRLEEIINQLKSRHEMIVMGNGSALAAERIASYLSPTGAFNQKVASLDYINFIKDLAENFEEKKEFIIQKFKSILTKVLQKKNLIIALNSDEKNIQNAKQKLTSILEELPKSDKDPFIYDLKPNKEHNEGFYIPGQVQYVGKGLLLDTIDKKYYGKTMVLKNILSTDYLWNTVRVQGGAYGGYGVISLKGQIIMLSYRDPNLRETLKNYDGAYQFFQNINLDERELRKYIIGTISELDTPLTPSMKGDYAFSMYLAGETNEMRRLERNNILNTTISDIKEMAEFFKDFADKGVICAIGNENVIKENKELFNSIKPVL